MEHTVNDEKGRNGHRPIGVRDEVMQNSWSVIITIEVGRENTVVIGIL
jgi:hypothetical protein